MPLMCPIYSSSPPSFSTYLKARKSGAWIWPVQDAVWVSAPASEEHKACQNLVNASSILSTLPHNQATHPPPNAQGTPVPTASHEPSGSRESLSPWKQLINLWVLAVGSAHNTITPNAEPAYLEPRSSNPLEPQSCTWGRKVLWRPRVDICPKSHIQTFLLSRTFSLFKGFQSPEANLCNARCLNPQLPTHHGMPTFCLFYTTLHLCIYEDRCVGMEQWMFFLIFYLGFLPPLSLDSLSFFFFSSSSSLFLNPSFFLNLLTSPGACVSGLPIDDFQSTVFTKPTPATKADL